MITPGQRKRLWALASKAGLDEGEVYQAIAERYGLLHTTALSTRQYEEFCRDLTDWAASRDEPDITPRKGDYLSCKGHLLMAVRQLADAGEFIPGASESDVALAVDLLDVIRKYRRSSRRISARQLSQFVGAWRRYPLPAWREAASRMLTQHTDKDEDYFVGILRNVARELRAAAVSRQAPEGPSAYSQGRKPLESCETAAPRSAVGLTLL
jgi:hypothetical protein